MFDIYPEVLFLQIALFCGLVYLLRDFVLDASQKVLAERRRKTTGAEEEARAMKEEVEAMRATFDQKLQEARQAGSAGSEEIRREAESNENRILESAREEAAKTLEDVRSRVASETDDARAKLRDDAQELARTAAEKILGRAVA